MDRSSSTKARAGAHWTIRRADVADARALSVLAERLFRDAFGAQSSPDEMDRYCSAAFTEAVQAAEIADPRRETWLAEQDGRLVAFQQLRTDQQPPAAFAGTPAMQLHRIYLDRALHGSGLAREMMQLAFERARAAGAGVLWLTVWEENPRAIAFYRKFRFRDAGEAPFVFGSEVHRDLVLAVDLAG